MGETLTLTAEDGHKFSAYKATPSGTPRGGIVVVQEIFGVNQHIRKVADSFAADGYVAIAPALFDRVERNFESGYGPQDIERGRATRGKLSTDQALMDVKATVKELAKGGQKVGVVGYCFGGTIAWLSATRVDGVSAAVGYYGGGVADAADEKPKSPVMLHFGETDASIPMEAVEKVKKAQPNVPTYVYAGAGHGFVCDERGSFHAESAKQARERTIDFFRKHIG
jgi:carboxymethylenebutenolidase